MIEIYHIIRREYILRIRRKSFVVTTKLVPLLLACFIGMYVSFTKDNKYDSAIVNLIDETGLIDISPNGIFNIEILSQIDYERNINDSFKEDIKNLIHVSKNNDTLNIKYHYRDEKPNLNLINYVEHNVTENMLDNYYKSIGIENLQQKQDSVRKLIKTDIISTSKGRQDINVVHTRVSIAIFLSIMIYLMIILYSSNVVYSIFEEKSNKVIEILLSSVSAIKIIIGKIIGITLLAFTQISLFIMLLMLFIIGLSDFLNIGDLDMLESNQNIGIIFKSISSINLGAISPIFIFFFIMGYLLYTSIFSIIASMIKNVDFRLVAPIVTFPLFFSLILISSSIDMPNLGLNSTLSMLPFTSPIVMMYESTMGVSAGRLAFSMGILTVTTILFSVIAGKLYQATILFSGKRISLRDIRNWIKR